MLTLTFPESDVKRMVKGLKSYLDEETAKEVTGAYYNELERIAEIDKSRKITSAIIRQLGEQPSLFEIMHGGLIDLLPPGKLNTLAATKPHVPSRNPELHPFIINRAKYFAQREALRNQPQASPRPAKG